MNRIFLILVFVLVGLCNVVVGQKIEKVFDPKTKTWVPRALTEEETKRNKFQLELQRVCDSLELDVEMKALFMSFSMVRTKCGTAPCCKYNNVFNARRILQGSTCNIPNIEGVGFVFPSVYKAVENAILYACYRKMTYLKKKYKVQPETYHIKPNVEEMFGVLVEITGGTFTDEEKAEFKETYPIILGVMENDEKLIKELLGM